MNKSLVQRFLPLGIVFLILVIVMPRNSRFPYDYRKGRAWKYETLFAQFDFPIYKTGEQMREERINSDVETTPYYKYSQEIVNKSIKAAEGLELGNLRSAVVSELRAIYSKGVIADESKKQDEHASDVIYIQKDKRAVKCPISEVYRQADAKAKLLADLASMSRRNLDSLFRAAGVYDILVPNVIFDQQTTELVHSESNAAISPTSGYVTAGQLIVSEGEIVTGEIEQMLDSYKKEFEANVGYLGPPVLLVLGNMVLAFVLVLLLFLIINFCYPSIFKDTRYPYVLVVFLLASLAALIAVRVNESALLFVPFTLSALMLQAFMRPKGVVVFYLASLLPLMIFSHDGPVLFMMYLTAGLVVVGFFRHFQQGWKQFIAAFITFMVLAGIYLACRAADLIAGNVWQSLLALFVGSMLTVAGYPLVYLFEKVFNLVSNSRLLELGDTSNPILRELEQKAPGTFQHSLQVGNMAEAVARSVDVNPDLVRAGALYHDIGKISNPLCFVENESLVSSELGQKYHQGISAVQSAHDIIRHVMDGVELARRHRLPDAIVDFIRSHHGTTCVRYFYSQFLKEGGDPEAIHEFTYDGMKPRTKAQIIVMLCDSVEAASRTLRESTPEAFSRFVESIVAGKMEEGQFDNADVSISELNTIKETLKQYLAQINHERVVYPKSKLNK